MFEKMVFLRDECEESISELFKREVVGSVINEEETLLILGEEVYDINYLKVSGAQPKEIGFFSLTPAASEEKIAAFNRLSQNISGQQRIPESCDCCELNKACDEAHGSDECLRILQ